MPMPSKGLRSGTAICAALLFGLSHAIAQDSIRREPLPPVQGEAPQQPPAPPLAEPSDEAEGDPFGADDAAAADDGLIPLPRPFKPDPDADPVETTGGEPSSPETLPEVVYGEDGLPEPVKRMRDLLMAAAKEGDIEKLRPLLGLGDSATTLSLGGVDGDPIAFLKSISGDGEGQEILAILQEVLEAGYVRIDKGTDRELYVWPYFFAYPLDALDKRQKVELFRLVTSGDYEDMRAFGGYIFYRVAITPEGEWLYFVSGD